jgi:hypothetical protein
MNNIQFLQNIYFSNPNNIKKFINKNHKIINEIINLSHNDSISKIKNILKNIDIFGNLNYFPTEIIIFNLANTYIDFQYNISNSLLLNDLSKYFQLNTKLNKNLESVILSNIDFIKNILSSKENIIDFIKSYFLNIESNLYKFDSYCLGMSLLKLSKKDKIYNSTNIYSLIYNMMNPDIDKRYTINQSIQFLESIQ